MLPVLTEVLVLFCLNKLFLL